MIFIVQERLDLLSTYLERELQLGDEKRLEEVFYGVEGGRCGILDFIFETKVSIFIDDLYDEEDDEQHEELEENWKELTFAS